MCVRSTLLNINNKFESNHLRKKKQILEEIEFENYPDSAEFVPQFTLIDKGK